MVIVSRLVAVVYTANECQPILHESAWACTRDCSEMIMFIGGRSLGDLPDLPGRLAQWYEVFFETHLGE